MLSPYLQEMVNNFFLYFVFIKENFIRMIIKNASQFDWRFTMFLRVYIYQVQSDVILKYGEVLILLQVSLELNVHL